MKIKKHFTAYQRLYEIDLRGYGLGQISVSQENLIVNNTWGKPNINWAACGDQDQEHARHFANALIVASQLSVCLNAEFSEGQTKACLLSLCGVGVCNIAF